MNQQDELPATAGPGYKWKKMSRGIHALDHWTCPQRRDASGLSRGRKRITPKGSSPLCRRSPSLIPGSSALKCRSQPWLHPGPIFR